MNDLARFRFRVTMTHGDPFYVEVVSRNGDSPWRLSVNLQHNQIETGDSEKFFISYPPGVPRYFNVRDIVRIDLVKE